MTGNEIALVALGLLVGIALGAVLVSVFGGRSGSSREVRLTVTRDVVPRRHSATLSGDPFVGPAEPAGGGPAERTGPGRAAAPSPAGNGTSVRADPPPFRLLPPSPSTIPRVLPPSAPPPDAIPIAPAARVVTGPTGNLMAVPVGEGVDPLIEALRREHRPAAVAVGAAVAAAAASSAGKPEGAGPGAPGSTASSAEALPDPAGGTTAAAGLTRAPDPAGPCAEARRIADERCEVASRARAEADRARDTLRAAQRSYDDELARAEEAARAADPRAVRAAKDAAQAAFRAARGAATTAEAVDAAARDWLHEINRINRATKAAATTVTAAQEAARALAGSLERLSAEADAARIAAESADEACLAARQALADCEEAASRPAATPPEPAERAAGPWYDDSLAAATAAGTALGAGTAPTIFRLLEGDHAALRDVVARLGGDDPEGQRHWQLLLTDLVDAILATAIDGAALEFPEDHAFWGPFTAAQSRDIVAALASLGYRFDGLGGWLDGRVPSQRDLSLALGYAGLDPMRMRTWPNETQMFELFSEVRVAAPEYLAGAAGDLTLGELVAMLGRRAEGLTDLWNAWGRVRPLLLEER